MRAGERRPWLARAGVWRFGSHQRRRSIAFPGGVPKQIGRSRRPPEAPRPLRLGNGVVQRAVIEALVPADRPMNVGEAHTAVEELLGRSVSRDSINSCLSIGARAARLRFERVTRGRYQLARSR
jgi:hypothetical protein